MSSVTSARSASHEQLAAVEQVRQMNAHLCMVCSQNIQC